jgi:hypothetical protein
VTGFRDTQTVGRTGAALNGQSIKEAAESYANGQTPTTIISDPGELGGLTLGPGVYNTATATTFDIAVNSTLTLDPGVLGANAVWIFQAASATTSLTVGSGSKIVMLDDGNPCNVFWVLGGTATIGTSANFIGNIMASTSITTASDAIVTGRLLANTANVVLGTGVTVFGCTCLGDPTPPPP